MIIGVNYYNVNSVVLESWKQINNSNNNVIFLALITPHFNNTIPEFMQKIELKNDAITILNYNKDLPLINDILKEMNNFNDNIYVYINADIILKPIFVDVITKIINNYKYDSVTMNPEYINKVDKLNRALKIKEQYNWRKELSVDGIAFNKKSLNETIKNIPKMFIGELWWDVVIKHFLNKNFNNFNSDNIIRHMFHKNQILKSKIYYYNFNALNKFYKGIIK